MRFHDFIENYGLIPIGGTCEECGRRYVKRSLYVPLPLTVDRCYGCKGAVPFIFLRWPQYLYWMDVHQATYVETATLRS